MENSIKVLTLSVNLRKRHPLKFVCFLCTLALRKYNNIVLRHPNSVEVYKNVFGMSLINVPKYALLSEIQNKMAMFKTRR